MPHPRVLSNFAPLRPWLAANEKIALWIGRAKLPHIGHVEFLYQLWLQGYKLIIGNGSCYSINPRNPIHVFQVQSMLALSLMNRGIPETDFIFVPIPDFNDNEAWKSFVTGIPDFDKISCLASGNPVVFEALGDAVKDMIKIGDEVVDPPIDIRATDLRNALRDNNRETWNRFAAFGTRAVLANAGGFHTIRSAILGTEVNFEPGRQCVDLVCFVHDGFEWNVIVGNRRKSDFEGHLALPGGGIEDYGNPPNEALAEFTEETGVPAEIIFPWSLPPEISIAGKLGHLHFVRMFSTADTKKGSSKGGSSLCFMTVFEGTPGELHYHIRSNSDLSNVRCITVREALQQGLAFQQTQMLEAAYTLLARIRRH